MYLYVDNFLEILWPSYKEHMVNALALIGDEGRDKLRKAMGSCTQAVIRGCPNGATHTELCRYISLLNT